MNNILYIHYGVDNCDDIDSILSFIGPGHTYETVDDLIEDNGPLKLKGGRYVSEGGDQFRFFSANELHLHNKEVVVKTELI